MSEPRRYRVLFICIGNSCRSPMAEAFARARHADVIEAFSAGLAPASIIQPETHECMAEKGLSLEGVRPKPLKKVDWRSMDLVVNMSGAGVLDKIPGFQGQDLIWAVNDPIGRGIKVYRDGRDRIEGLVERLAEALRRQACRESKRQA